MNSMNIITTEAPKHRITVTATKEHDEKKGLLLLLLLNIKRTTTINSDVEKKAR